jgi:hypothetical protein
MAGYAILPAPDKSGSALFQGTMNILQLIMKGIGNEI